MPRFFPVAILSALLALAPAALAQHPGHAGANGVHSGNSGWHGSYSGYHGGMAAPHYGGSFGTAPRFYGPGSHTVSVAPHYDMGAGRIPVPGRMPVYRPAYRPGYGVAGGPERRWDHGRDHDGRGRHYGHGGYGYNKYGSYGYGAYPGFVNSWQLLPWDLDTSDFGAEDTSAGPPAAQSSQPSEQPEYVPSSEDAYRLEYNPSSDEVPAPPLAQASQAAPPAPLAPEPRLTLIFRDGHTQQIRNYVLTQDTLLDMDQADSGRMARIPLASLNLPATEKAAQRAGLEFSPPAS